MAKSFVIIGAGPGGESAAKRAAARGAQVTVVEKRDLGGLCLNRGCIPSKTLLETGRLLSQIKTSADCLKGLNGVQVHWETLQKRRENIVASLRNFLTQNLARLKVRVVNGEARFEDSKTIVVRGDKGEERLAFDVAIIATGSRPFFPEPFAEIQDQVLDSDRVLELAKVPASLLVVGGGAVGCEFACLFHELGTRVTLVEKTAGLLPGEDPAIVRILRASFEKRGIRIVTEATVEKVEKAGGVWKSKLASGDTIETDDILVCVGRRPAVDGLNTEAAGIRTEKGKVPVNAFLQSSRSSIYAVGDVNGLSLLAHAASAQGETAVDHALGDDRAYAHHLVPRCLYTWPEVASVGDWAHSAEAKGIEVRSQRFFFQASAKAMATSETEGFIQIISEKAGNGRLLGGQIIGPHATELIHIISVALQGGLNWEQLRGVIFAHPTLSEGVREALSR